MYNSDSSPTLPFSRQPMYSQDVGSAISSAGDISTLPFGTAALEELTFDSSWTLVEEGFTLAREHEVESLFAIANGYVGNRGSLAEGSPLSAPATFLAGVFQFEEKPHAVPGFLVLPDWTGVRAWIEDLPLHMEQGEMLAHRRILDMRCGVLWREWRHRDTNGRVTRIVSFRLASLADRHLLVQSVAITPENYGGKIRLETSIELPANVGASPPPEEWKTRRAATRPNLLPLALKSPGRDVTVAFGATSQLVALGHHVGRRDIEVTERRITERFDLNVEIGAEYRLDRLISIYTSRETPDPAEAAIAHTNQYVPGGIPQAVAANKTVWEARWRHADVEVEGDTFLQKSLRFAGYHLISAANPEDEWVSIGARALTGEAYKGHVFWDTEIYMLPFYMLTDPASARALLMYRYHTLEKAREKARSYEYRGAMYPWESADTGEETTPDYVIGPDGKVIRVLNGALEIHISADIAYAVWQYWQVTADDEFFRQAGAEIVLETARFWASRGALEADGFYHLRHVIGPDEYHEDVDDNAYTNLMAAWNLRRGAETVRILSSRWPEQWQELSARLQLTHEEAARWSQLADLMYVCFDPKTKLLEQFQGYYRKEHVDLKAYEPRHAAMDVILGHERIQSTNVVKQADVLMAIYLLWNQFLPEVRRANFRYYEPRTGHGSSLSPSIHALVAARLGEMETARAYLRQAAEIDLGNNMGNAAGGVHAAAIGGLWQAMVFGFAGTEIRTEGLAFDPHLLPHWGKLSFPLQFRGRKLRLSFQPAAISVQIEDGNEELSIGVVHGPEILARPHQRYIAERTNGAWGPWQEHSRERT
jgi:trehalose/maltose hydrolase-like predicted phosphorylase